MPTITNFLLIVWRSLIQLRSTKKLPQIETDWSRAMIQAACMAANNMDVSKYLQCVYDKQLKYVTHYVLHMS